MPYHPGLNAPSRLWMPSKKLEPIVGPGPVGYTEAISKLWQYVKDHDLQVATDRRLVRADNRLRAVFGADCFTMFEVNKAVSRHLREFTEPEIS